MPDVVLNRRVPRLDELGQIVLDATLTEEHDFAAEVTAHPVEDGAEISDHIRNQPARIRLEGVVADAPLEEDAEPDPERVQAAFDALLDMREKRELVTVVTGLKVYDDMALSQLRVPRDRKTGTALFFTAEMQHVRKVRSRTVALPGAPKPSTKVPGVKDQATPKGDLGKQNAAPASPETTEKGSLAYEAVFGS